MLSLRPYQHEMVAATEAAWTKHQRVLNVAATGTGKTETFMELIRRCVAAHQRALVLVDQQELVYQPVRRISDRLGIAADIEMGEYRAATNIFGRSPVVVSTFQTQGSGTPPRRERFDPKDFGLVIVDEAHRTITKGRIETLRYYTERNPDLRVAGFTATPDRGDGRALGTVYQAVAYEYGILDAIGEGWLVPVLGKTIVIDSADLSALPDLKRDYTDDEIGEIMEQDGPLMEQMEAIRRECGDRPTIIYCARVAHAKLLAAGLNRDIRDGCAAAIHGETPREQRAKLLSDFEERKTQFLANCDVLTTGVDLPLTSCVVIARPTKSRARFAQCVGRGTRPLKGVVDGLDDDDARQRAIAESGKPDCLVLSLVGKGGGIDLVGPADALAGSFYSDEDVERAREMMEDGETRELTEVLSEAKEKVAEEREQSRRALVQVNSIEYRTKDVDLFQRGAVDLEQNRPGEGGLPATTEQVLRNAKVPESLIERLQLHPKEGGRLAREIIRRRRAGLCTFRQGRWLMKLGVPKAEIKVMSFEAAQAEIRARTGK